MQYRLPSIIRTKYFQPRNEDIPAGDAHNLSFRFNPLLPMDVQELTRVMPHDVVFYAANGSFSGQSANLGGQPPVFTQLYHIHNGLQLPMFNKPAPLSLAFGSGQKPNPILPTYFVPAGDSLMMEVRSQDRTNSMNVEGVLIGSAINYDSLNKYQKMVLDSKRRQLDATQPPNKDIVGDQTPAGAAPLVLSSTQNFPYPLPAAAAIPIFSYQVPAGQRVRIFEHALVHIGGNPPDMIGNVIWRFLVNGWPLKGLGAQIAQIGSFSTPDRVVIWLTENDLFQVTVEVIAGAPAQIGSTAYRINGYTVPTLAKGTSGGQQ